MGKGAEDSNRAVQCELEVIWVQSWPDPQFRDGSVFGRLDSHLGWEVSWDAGHYQEDVQGRQDGTFDRSESQSWQRFKLDHLAAGWVWADTVTGGAGTVFTGTRKTGTMTRTVFVYHPTCFQGQAAQTGDAGRMDKSTRDSSSGATSAASTTSTERIVAHSQDDCYSVCPVCSTGIEQVGCKGHCRRCGYVMYACSD